MRVRAAAPILLIVGLAYPFLLYTGVGGHLTHPLLLVMAVLWVLRGVLAKPVASTRVRLGALAIGVFCVVAAIVPWKAPALFYPVMVNAMLGLLFGHSLIHGPSLVEQIATRQQGPLDGAGQRYTRRVTRVWTLFFVANGLCCAALALWAPLSWWTLYTGVIAYLLMAILFVTEWWVRPKPARRGLHS